MLETIKDIFKSKSLIYDLAISDFKKRFAGSFFGIVWMFVQPIVTILIYFFVFQVGFKSTPPEPVPYVLWLIPGIIPWFYFNEAIGAATNSLYDYNYLVKKVVFNIDILPIVKIGSCFIVHLIFVYIMLCVFLLFGQAPTIYWLQAVYYSFCLSVLIVGIGYITSAIKVFFQDMGQIVEILLMVGMWLAPIMWHYSMLPPTFQFLLRLNPIFYIVEGYRDTFIRQTPFWNNIALTGYYWVFTIIVLIIGLKLYKKLKPHFADVL